jgi:hypothetical protein
VTPEIPTPTDEQSEHQYLYTLTNDEFQAWQDSWTDMPAEEYIADQRKRARGNQWRNELNDADSEEVHIKNTSRIKLPDGRLSMIVDLGSQVNVVGINTQKEFAEKAKAAGRDTSYVNRSRRMNLNGVGSGSAPCDYEAICPIAVKYLDKSPMHDVFRANVAEGCGADLPAIFGSVSMQKKDAVIMLREGKEIIAFPGPGGYKIEWSPGTKLLPMIPAPSGHLVIPCDHFDGSGPTTKDPSEQMSFCTDHTNQE